MNRLQHLAEVERALQPVKEILQAARVGANVAFNPLVMQIALGYAHVQAIAALAADEPDGPTLFPLTPDVIAAAAADLPAVPAPAEQPPAPPNGGLIVPT